MDVNFHRIPGHPGFVPYIQNIRDYTKPPAPSPTKDTDADLFDFLDNMDSGVDMSSAADLAAEPEQPASSEDPALSPEEAAEVDTTDAALPEPETLIQSSVYVVSDDVEDLEPLLHSQTVQKEGGIELQKKAPPKRDPATGKV